MHQRRMFSAGFVLLDLFSVVYPCELLGKTNQTKRQKTDPVSKKRKPDEISDEELDFIIETELHHESCETEASQDGSI